MIRGNAAIPFVRRTFPSRGAQPALALAALVVASVALAVAVAAPQARAEDHFALKDGDRVVFYGDSITDQRLYTTFIETYAVTRFPDRKIAFVHSGWGGDRVTGGGGGPIDHRLERDVFAYKPNVVTVMLGMNDGSYQPFKQSIFETYTRGYEHLVQSLKSHLPDARLTLIVPSPFDDVTRKPNFEGGYNQVLLRYGEFVRSLAEKEGANVADLNGPVVEALKKARELDPKLAQRLIPDRVHPGPSGHLLMAEAVLKSWNAPALVSAVAIDAAAKSVEAQDNAQVTEARFDDTIAWTQKDGSLPMPIDLKDPLIALAVKASDVEEALNRQMLKVSGLKADRYQLAIDGQDVAELTRDQLARGVELARLETPMLKQAQDVHALTLEHNNIHFSRWRTIQVPHEGRSYESMPSALAGIDALEAEVVARQRAAAQPKARKFELRPR